MTIRQAYEKCKKALEAAGFEGADFEALSLMELNRAKLISYSNNELDPEFESKLFSRLERRLSHEPLQYILGSWSFCGLELFVGEGVLIPRDDTEVALNLCAEFLNGRKSKKTLDLCSGSGAIAVALDKIAEAEAIAVELFPKAYEFLLKNINHNKSTVLPYNGDIFTCHSKFPNGEFDLIVSNPPYIKSSELESLQSEVQFEPKTALDGGESGYIFYEAIISAWSSKLKAGGALVFELGEGQAEYVASLMKKRGFENIRTEIDFGGIERAIIGTMLNI